MEDRRRALNMALPSFLLEPLLDFVMQPVLLGSLPPLLQCKLESEQVGDRKPKLGNDSFCTLATIPLSIQSAEDPE